MVILQLACAYIQIRMANLAIISSHTVNGVARIHTEILKSQLFADWDRLWPGKIINITNGVTPRYLLLFEVINVLSGGGYLLQTSHWQRFVW